ncbi:MAG: SRPBCC family protein [Anaerolineae bacterium]|jgi:hypothetical protein|nr:SRPBCC family protein [Anaerolineae bacterium]
MARALRSLHLGAPVDEVRDFLQEPANMLEWWPDCDEIDDLRVCDVGAIAFKYADKPAGVMCRGEVEERVVGDCGDVALHLTGDLHGDMRWRIEAEDGGTRVTFESDYDMPVRALIPYLSPVRLLRYQEDEADQVAAKLREKFEG